MSLNDPLAAALSKINNAELASKVEVVITPASKQMKPLLEILKKEGYVADFEEISAARGGQIRVKLARAINQIGAIKPRFSYKLANSERFEKRFLPAKDFGRLVISTSQGMMTHIEAKQKQIGGVLIAYVY